MTKVVEYEWTISYNVALNDFQIFVEKSHLIVHLVVS